VTVTLPDFDKRYMRIVIDRDHYASKTVYAPGTFTFSKGEAVRSALGGPNLQRARMRIVARTALTTSPR
jgi:hypothetical protein